MRSVDSPTITTALRPAKRSLVRRWLARLWRECTVKSRRPIAPAFAKPEIGETFVLPLAAQFSRCNLARAAPT
jgi:hypothetical protein